MVFCLVGSPLSGKSTIGERIAVDLGISYFSTGEFARKMGMNPKEESIKSDDISVNLNDTINNKVFEEINKNAHIIIDGFPRSEEQIVLLNKSLAMYTVIYFYADPVMIVDRALKRKRNSDEMDIVAGRIESAVRLKMELKSKCNSMFVYTITSTEEDFDTVKSYISDCISEIEYYEGALQ